MISYIVRRLLLMIPTLIGITFLIFMLIALSPGGIGASLRVAGGQMEASSRALQEAYLEERYGLDDPPVVQYVRWLARISPVKFGRRDQIDPTGEFIRAPKALDPPPLAGSWYGDGAPQPPRPEVYEFERTVVAAPEDLPAGARFAGWLAADGAGVSPGEAIAEVQAGERSITIEAPKRGLLEHARRVGEAVGPGAPLGVVEEDRAGVYRRASQQYAQARGGFIQARTELEIALRDYAALADVPRAVGPDDEINAEAFARFGPRAETPEQEAALARIRAEGLETLEAYERALAERADLVGVFRAGPFPEAGFWVIPGAVSIGPPDFGVSFSRNRPVLDLIGQALPVTLTINLIAFPIIYIIAIPSGILAATRAGSWVDVGLGGLLVALWSIPVVWAGVLAVGYLANDNYLGWFPEAGLHSPESDDMPFLPSWGEDGFRPGYALDALWHLALPVACLVYAGFAVLSKQTRAAMLDNFNADYVRTAKAKGVKPSDIVYRHVFRNSLLPLITMFATIFPAMLAGSVVVERIFSIPGMGSLIIDSIYQRDRELLLATTLMIAATNLLALLLADILYALADPRITYN